MLTSRDSGLGRRGTTNAQGTAGRVAAAPGTYLVAASRVGFKTELIRDVRLQASVKSTLSIVLRPATVDERVDVTADRTTLVAGDSAVGEVIDRETIASLPVLERDALQFAQQAPGVAPPAPGLAPVDARQRRPERLRRPRIVQQLPARRRRQQRPLPQPARRQPEPRGHRGNLAPPEHLRRRLRAQRRRPGERRRAIRHERPQGHRLRVLPHLEARRPQQPAARRQPRAAAPQAPVRRRPWAARSAAGRRSSSPTSRASTPSRPRRAWLTCRPAPSAPATSALPASPSSIRSRSGRSPAT